ncbi:hypothetical protein [Arundinibacter roseus]|uniref:Uncharacterized protein n=1 Tax=Arundinibacter roseus TaxID=2070510 RepID=A0A4R4KBF2_9BACT|nr:hypothetical protein [Arundinibacter roseus]TDB65088.1 hypothetical protein EZE20_10240 [Arundinibacter roseus]
MNQLLGIGSRVRHPDYGVGVVINQQIKGHEISFVNHGVLIILYDEQMDIIEAVAPDTDRVSMRDIELVLSRVLKKWADVSEIVPLGQKWQGGSMILTPGVSGLQNKEWPIETFFHKIVMLRDRLRVLEQRLNASGLTDEEKVSMQQYITRCYGSLTSFNVLFQDKNHHFVGERGKE